MNINELKMSKKSKKVKDPEFDNRKKKDPKLDPVTLTGLNTKFSKLPKHLQDIDNDGKVTDADKFLNQRRKKYTKFLINKTLFKKRKTKKESVEENYKDLSLRDKLIDAINESRGVVNEDAANPAIRQKGHMSQPMNDVGDKKMTGDLLSKIKAMDNGYDTYIQDNRKAQQAGPDKTPRAKDNTQNDSMYTKPTDDFEKMMKNISASYKTITTQKES